MGRKKAKIVSANYLDRNSELKWLVRDKKESADSAKPVRTVIAKNVNFIDSNDFERGFGCGRVALCKSTVKSDTDNFEVPDTAIQIFFAGYRFVDNKYAGNVVEKCKTLYLRSDGKMFAEL